MNTVSKTAFIAVLAAVAGAAVSYLMLSNQQLGGQSGAAAPAAQDQRKPLYWVAPMDPAYRRDAPGKSPMGMDLVPVYENDETIAGTVRISPEVINNLGVRIAPVEYQVLPTRIRTVGYVQYDEDRRVHIHPRVEGWIEKLYVKASGDPVEAGQPLYELYSPQLVNAQEELVLALKRDNSRLVAAAEDRLRALQLSPDSIARLRRDREVKQTVTFHAPQTGVVDNLNVREGFFVMPGTTLMSVGVLEEVWVEAEVFERQASLVSVGLPVTMSLDYLPGRDWQGRVDYVYPSLDEKNRTLRVRLRFANEDRILKPNMFAQVVIQAGPVVRALVVPREAVIRTGKQDRVVLALGEGRFASRVVEPGRVGEHYIEILKGLAEHDEVVVSAQFLLDSESSKSADLKRMDSGDSATAFPTGESGMGHRHEMGGSHD
jgi:Cu(I)/Ag(I) efflux system membrane fusion protein